MQLSGWGLRVDTAVQSDSKGALTSPPPSALSALGQPGKQLLGAPVILLASLVEGATGKTSYNILTMIII